MAALELVSPAVEFLGENILTLNKILISLYIIIIYYNHTTTIFSRVLFDGTFFPASDGENTMCHTMPSKKLGDANQSVYLSLRCRIFF